MVDSGMGLKSEYRICWFEEIFVLIEFNLRINFIAFHYIAPFPYKTDLGSLMNIVYTDIEKNLITTYFD